MVCTRHSFVVVANRSRATATLVYFVILLGPRTRFACMKIPFAGAAWLQTSKSCAETTISRTTTTTLFTLFRNQILPFSSLPYFFPGGRGTGLAKGTGVIPSFPRERVQTPQAEPTRWANRRHPGRDGGEERPWMRLEGEDRQKELFITYLCVSWFVS